MDNELKKVFIDMLTGYEKEYAIKYEECIPRLWSGIKEEDREKVYKMALEQGKTWQEVVGYKFIDGIILRELVVDIGYPE